MDFESVTLKQSLVVNGSTKWMFDVYIDTHLICNIVLYLYTIPYCLWYILIVKKTKLLVFKHLCTYVLY